MREKDDSTPVSSGGIPPRPDRIGCYRVLDVLGEGGMGVVYLARQTEPIQRDVALKVIKLGMDTRDAITRFEAERQALALLDHPHVAKVIDAGCTVDGRPYFVMEHVPGIAIDEYCDRHQLDLVGRQKLFVQVCRGLHHAHERGIIHRDVKPSNVLVATVDDRPWAKIIDFGVAKAMDRKLTEHTLFTEDGRIMGTPAYMSPEQAGSSTADVDPRTDVYSLGMILYELLVGSLPFDKRELQRLDFIEMRRRIREAPLVTPSTRYAGLGSEAARIAALRGVKTGVLWRELRRDLDWITMKALERDRDDRYPSAAELADDIERHLRDEPVSAGPPAAGVRLSRWLRRHRARAPLAGAILVLLLAVLYASEVANPVNVENPEPPRTAAARRPDIEGRPLAVNRLLEATGGVLDLADLRGRKVLLVVAGGVYGQARSLQVLENDLAACGRTLPQVEVVVVFPLPRPELPAATRIYASLFGVLPFVVALDDDLALAKSLGIETAHHVFPTLVLLDEQGVVKVAYTGADEPSIAAALEAVIVRIVLA